MWLDRGELDKFIERAERPRGGDPERRHRDDEYRGKPRKSFLRDLFD